MKTQASGSLKPGWVLTLTLILAAASPPLFGATLTVTNVVDSGPGSLREAILSANLSVSTPDIIHFNIDGAGPHTINPLTPLPTVTDPVTIDGYSQPGASVNTLADGDNAVLKIEVLGTLVIDTTNSVVRGLALHGIDLGTTPNPNGNNVIEGNFIGLDASGTNSFNSLRGVFVQTPNNRIGGTTPMARNILSGHETTGLEIFETFASGNLVEGNFIGTDRTGTKAAPNGDRAVVINMNASANIIGGMVPGARNVISGNLNRGITLDGFNNRVQGNFIGTDVTGLQPLGNARSGVEISGPDNLVGGTNSGAGNVIAFNGVDGGGIFTTNGVDVAAGTINYSILGNSIFDNAGLGIDVNADKLVTAGFPVLTLASNTTVATVIRGTHTPITSFRLELFTNPTCDPSGNGEGRWLLTSTDVVTDAGGNFTLNWPVPIPPGLFLTATGDGTTEFSKCQMVVAAGTTNSWASTGGGKWEDGPNWSLGVPPYIGHRLVQITNPGSKTVSNDASTAAGFPSTMTISNLLISAAGGATNTLLLAHNGTGTPLRVLRNLTLNRGGALVIQNAALRLEGPPGTSLSIDGDATLAGGLLTTIQDGVPVIIGRNGPGALTVSNGTLLAGTVIVGPNDGSDGIWHIAGGTNVVTSTFDIADSLTATGMVWMTGGRLTTPNVYIGLFGNARLMVSDGIFECAGQGNVASQDGAQGNFTAAGGTSRFASMVIGENALAVGSMLVTGAALVRIEGPLENRGKVTVAGGNLDVLGQLDSEAPGNSISVTGGQFAATNDNAFLTSVTVSDGTFLARDVFLGNQKTGAFTVAGGVVALPGSFNGFSVGVNGGTGMVWQTGGEINLTNTDLNVGGLFGPATGQMTVSNGTTRARNLFVGGQGGGIGTVTVVGGELTASNLEVNETSQLIFHRGLLQTRTAAVANNSPFVVGDGVNTATYRLLGGINAFTKGLRIAGNGLLGGDGTLTAAVTNAGVIAPGASAGRIDIIGTLVLSNSSELRFELGGYTPATQFDFLGVTGGATLGGTLSVSLLDQFHSAMTNGASFTLLTAGSPFGGAFGNVGSGGTLTTTEGYARFTVLYAGATALRLTGLVIVDTDADGMPDWWEDQFSLDKHNPADATLDSDGDGASNAGEFAAGTLPNNSNSVFRILAIQPEAADMRITWSTVGGKSYRVQTNAPLVGGGFINNFADFSPLITVPGTGESTTNIVDSGATLSAPGRYYRVRLGP